MRNLFLYLLVAMSLGTLTRGEEPVKQASPHIYVATRVVPRVLSGGTLVIDVKDDDGAQAVVALPPDLIDQLIALSGRKTPILYGP